MWSSCPFSLLKTIQGTNYLYWRGQLSCELNSETLWQNGLTLNVTSYFDWRDMIGFFVTCSHVSVRFYGKKLVCTHRREHRETAGDRGTKIIDLEVTLPRPLLGIPDKPQLCARVTPIKMTLRTPCRWRQSLHKGMGHVMGCEHFVTAGNL